MAKRTEVVSGGLAGQGLVSAGTIGMVLLSQETRRVVARRLTIHPRVSPENVGPLST